MEMNDLRQAEIERVEASFRDPSGYLFVNGGALYRRIFSAYKIHYDHLRGSGLYQKLTDRRLLIRHEEIDKWVPMEKGAYLDIKPENILIVSYPYEWSFSQLKDAALLTLDIMKESLSCGMILKDASAYNVQFHRGKPILIDTLSFEKYVEGQPWMAYRQFCEHFLAPLAVMALRDIRLIQLLKSYLDGLPLNLASSLLPWKTYLRVGFLTHIHLHAWSGRYFSEKVNSSSSQRTISLDALLAIIVSLEKAIKSLNWEPAKSQWVRYYSSEHSYPSEAMEEKKQFIEECLASIQPTSVLDLGANTGVFSRIAVRLGIETVSCDSDPGCVEISYRSVRDQHEEKLLPLLTDLTNPTPAIGWDNRERLSFGKRVRGEAVFALALVHHLAISNNVPLANVAAYFAKFGKHLIVEFIPKADDMVRKMLSTREDIFSEYSKEGFEYAFGEYFKIVRTRELKSSSRTIYLMERNGK
jgi:ribosomal protein L11 methylase PrmA